MQQKKHNNMIDNPHDKLCFSALRNHNIARDALRSVLPKKLLEKIDLNRLKLYNTKLITPQMKELQADIFYEAPFKETTALILFHFEQVTNAFRTLPLKVWQYLLLELMEYGENYPNEPLPVPFPVIIYTGERRFSYSTNLFDLFGDHKELAQSLLNEGVKLIDVCRMPDEDIFKNKLFGLCEYAFKHKKTKNFVSFLEKLIPWLGETEDEIGPNYVKMLIQYVIDAFPNGNAQLFTEQIKTHLSRTMEDGTMTIAEQWKQEGIELGKQEGLELGKQEGMTIAEQWKQEGIELGKQEGMTIAEQWKQEGMQQGVQKQAEKIALKMFKKNLSLEDIAELTGLSVEKITQLQRESIC